MTYKHEFTLFQYMENLRREFRTRPLVLGGHEGPDGGSGGPSGGYQGYIPQKKVAYDTDEVASSGTPTENRSLVDNLKHIRYRIGQLENSYSGVTVEQGGIIVASGITILNFLGSAVVADTGGGSASITVLSSGGATYHHDLLNPDAYDDHPQYLNQSRGDTYYYRKEDIDAMIGMTMNSSIFFLPGQLIVSTGVGGYTLLAPPTETGYVLTSNLSESTLMEWAPASGVVTSGGTSGPADWNTLLNKPDTFPPSTHTHDDRYYTETELSTSGGGGQVHYNNVTNIPSLYRQVEWTFNGDLSVSSNQFTFRNLLGSTQTISEVFIETSIAPSGSNLIVDIHKNGTTIFTNQANRPVIVAGALSGTTTTIDVSSFLNREGLTAHIDQVGSSTPGAYLTVTVVYHN